MSASKRVPKLPFLWIIGFFIPGILVGYFFSFSSPWMIWGGLFISCAWMAWLWKKETVWSVAPIVFLTGMVMTSARMDELSRGGSGNLGNTIQKVPQHLSLRGIVKSDPVFRIREKKEIRFPARPGGEVLSAEFEFQVEAVQFRGEWEAVTGRVLVQRTQPTSRGENLERPIFFEYGQRLELEGNLDEPPVPTNFGLFNYKNYLWQQGIACVFQSEVKDGLRVLRESTVGWLFKLRRELDHRLTLGIEADDAAVGIIKGMLLGYREDIPVDVSEAFRRTGTLHVFAISGSHISLLTMVVLFVLRRMRVPWRWMIVAMLPVLILFVEMTGLRSSSIRSVIMAVVVIAGWSLERPSALLNNLGVAAFLILAWNPLQLFDPGFQLSFGVVAALILWTPFFDEALKSWFEPDPWIPKMYLPQWRVWMMPALRWIRALFSVSLAAWLGSVGMGVYYFHLFSGVSLLANLFIVPMASASVALGVVSLAAGMIWDWLGITLNFAHAGLIHGMLWITDELSSLGGYCYVDSFKSWVIVLFYIGLLSIFVLWRGDFRRSALGMMVGMLTLILGEILYSWISSTVRLDILDVKNGQSILITGPRFERILLDAGSSYSGEHIVKPFLRSRGVNAIDLAIISHGDAEHCGGMVSLMKEIPIRRLIVADANFRSKSYSLLLSQFHEKRIPIEHWNDQSSEKLNSGILKALWPLPDASAPRADDFGLVLDFKTKHGRCLFLSDSGAAVEEMVEPRFDSGYEVIVQGWNGDHRLFLDGFIESKKPDIIALNFSEDIQNVLMGESALSELGKKGGELLTTAERGGLKIWMGGSGIRTETCLQKDK